MKSQQGSILKHFKRSTADEDLEEERVVIETANVQVMNVLNVSQYAGQPRWRNAAD